MPRTTICSVSNLSEVSELYIFSNRKPGARRSRKFSITAKGSEKLAHEWAKHLTTDRTDLDSILHIAYLAWLHGDWKACQDFLKRSADGLRGWAGSLHAESERLATKFGTEPDGNTFVWMSKHCEAARAEADADALTELSAQIGKRTGTKRRTKTAK